MVPTVFYPFKIDKAMQAAGVLLGHQEHGQMEYIRLLKLLYIADREAVRDTGRPIVGSQIVALKKGPLHSRVYDLIKGEDIEAVQWCQFFRTVGVDIEQIAKPGVGALSRYDIRKLTAIHRRYQDVDTWDLVEETHAFAEWRRNYPDPEESTSRVIPFEHVVEAVGRADELSQIQDDLREACEMERLFGQPAV